MEVSFFSALHLYDVFFDPNMTTLVKSQFALLTSSHVMKTLTISERDFLFFDVGVVRNHFKSNVL